MSYTKENIIGAALLPFAIAKGSGEEILLESNTRQMILNIDLAKLEVMFSNFYDEQGKEKFRKYASVDAIKMKQYFDWMT